MLIGLVNGYNHTKCVSLTDQKCDILPTFIDLHPNECSQELHYCPVAVELEDTLNDLSNKVCVPNKTEDLNLSVSTMITGINESKKLTKHLLCECKCRFDGRKCNSEQWRNNDKCRC